MFGQFDHIIRSFSLVLVLIISPIDVRAETFDIEKAMKKAAYGSADAPVKILEFASLGCGHCASFHNETLPKLKSDYIDKGVVQLIFNDFPISTPALAATMIARCAGPKKYLGMVEIFFKRQKNWIGADDPLGGLKQVARFGGLSSLEVDQCLNNQPLLKVIQETARTAQEMYSIQSTPSFVINSKTYAGNISYEKLKEIINKELKLE